MQPFEAVSPAALTSGSTLAVMHRPWFLLIKVVLENVPEDDRGAWSEARNAAELMLELAMLVAVTHRGRLVSVSGDNQAFCDSRSSTGVRTAYRGMN